MSEYPPPKKKKNKTHGLEGGESGGVLIQFRESGLHAAKDPLDCHFYGS